MRIVLALLVLVGGCQASAPSTEDPAIAAIRTIHGGVGPWVVMGHRMGTHALKALGLPAGSFDLEVIHHAPQQVQYSCVADGAAAATGASLGKLNLRMEPADPAQVHTTFRNRKTGASITLAPAETFAARFKDLPREKLDAAGREVLALPDADVFRVVP